MEQRENNTFYVYCHRKKTDGSCFYIGKGTRDRYKNNTGRNQYWWNTVNKHGFEPEILINNISEAKAFELESIICNHIGYKNLTNIRKETGWGGYSMNNSTKEKLRISLTGRKISDNHKKNISVKNKGIKKPESFGEKVSQGKTGHICYESQERSNKISLSLIGKKKSKEHIQNMKKPKPKGFGKIISEKTKGRKIPQHQIEAGIKARNKVTYQYSKDGILINTYESSKLAAQAIGVHEVNMRLHLSGKYKTCKGYIFKYKERL